MATYKGHNEDSSGNLLLNIGNGMTATVELGSTASQAYTKGAYLFFNNRFCKASSAINSGATLTIGSNLTETSIGAELTSHLRSSDGKEFYFDVKNGQYGYYPSASKTSSEFVPFGGTTGKIPDSITFIKSMTSSGISTSFSLTNCSKGDIYVLTWKYAGSPHVYWSSLTNATAPSQMMSLQSGDSQECCNVYLMLQASASGTVSGVIGSSTTAQPTYYFSKLTFS